MSAEVWSAVCPAPVEAKKIAVRQMMDLKAEAEAATGKRIWTDPSYHADGVWRVTGTVC